MEVEEKTLLSQRETNDTLWEEKPYCSTLLLLQMTAQLNNKCTNQSRNARPELLHDEENC